MVQEKSQNIDPYDGLKSKGRKTDVNSEINFGNQKDAIEKKNVK